MIRLQSKSAVLVPLALAALPLLAHAADSAAPTTTSAAPNTSVAVGPPAVIADPSPSANMAYQAQRGIVISRPGANAARISLGSRNGIRVGSRVEFLKNGLQFATGTVNSLNYADAVVNISPEPADPYVGINTDIRILEIPSHNLGPTQEEIDEKDYNRFERNFAISAAVAAAVYYIWIKD